MTSNHTLPAILALAFSIAPLAAEAPGVHPESWPAARRAPVRDARIERRVDAILRRMSLEEKAGQVIQGRIVTVKPEDVKTFHLGAVLNGGGG